MSSIPEESSILQESDQGSRDDALPSNFEATQPSIDSRRLRRDETVKDRNKAEEEELWFLQWKFKPLENSETSLATIGAKLENINRLLDVMEAGDQRHVQVETGHLTEDVHDLIQEEYTDRIDDDFMPKPAVMRRDRKESQATTSQQSPNNMTRY